MKRYNYIVSTPRSREERRHLCVREVENNLCGGIYQVFVTPCACGPAEAVLPILAAFGDFLLGRPNFGLLVLALAEDLLAVGGYLAGGRGFDIDAGRTGKFHLRSLIGVVTDVVHVWELLENRGWNWNLNLLKELFSDEDCTSILRIKSINHTKSDKWMWDMNAKGDYQVAKAYSRFVEGKFRTLDIAESSGQNAKNVNARLRSWRLNIKGKIKHFIWRSFNNTLPVSNNLKKRGLDVDWVCHRCGDGVETVEHLFFQCDLSKQVWKMAPVNWDFCNASTDSFKVWWGDVCSISKKEISEARIQLTTYILWWLWKSRNLWIFKKEWMPVHVVIKVAVADWQEFLEKNKRG
ncbi:Unknown protein [Striga hermonthica]|uniref:Reverse transcriptase zinc-binding domain-containing protein n=1 Tax=Striga hermonthica TaxID=68872 RepID=A0A9N7NYA4_STRHE|nr:Unknown protein [Striga hermonthica]